MFIPASIGLWLVIILIAVLFHLSLGGAIVAGILCTILHWLSELMHQLGHAWAAQRTGYPMSGIRFGTHVIFSTALYPANEPTLPAKVHLRRAAGGPLISGLLSVVALVLLLIAQAAGTGQFVAWFFFLENLLVLTLQAVIPLGFNDGSTIWHYLRRK